MTEKTIAALSSPMSDLSIEILRSGAEVAAAFTGLSALRADVDWATEKPSRRRRAHLRQLASKANRAGFGELSSLIAHAQTQGAGSNPTLLGWSYVRLRVRCASAMSQMAARINAMAWLSARGIHLAPR